MYSVDGSPVKSVKPESIGDIKLVCKEVCDIAFYDTLYGDQILQKQLSLLATFTKIFFCINPLVQSVYNN